MKSQKSPDEIWGFLGKIPHIFGLTNFDLRHYIPNEQAM